jgi:hypothetical protein
MKSGKLFNGSFSNYQNEIEAILREHRILSDNLLSMRMEVSMC